MPQNLEQIIMKTVVHKANTRGHANHGWLDTHHTFSFADYYNPERMGFGVIRVLNDDVVIGGTGFGTHPHENMEIISIPLKGALEHKDSMGNTFVIKENDIQIMSAGTGIMHSEYNKNKDKPVNFLQIWVFPDKKNVTPRYDQVALDPGDRVNKLQQIISPNTHDEGVWIHQNAWFYLGKFNKSMELEYTIKQNSNGLYLFIIEGQVIVNNLELNKRDGMGIWEIQKLNLNIKENSELLLMDIPMNQ